MADADFVLYVSANGTGKCMDAASSGGELIAFATHCQQEAALDRYVLYMLCTYIHTYVCTHVCMYVCMYIHTYIHTYSVHIYIHALQCILNTLQAYSWFS